MIYAVITIAISTIVFSAIFLGFTVFALRAVFLFKNDVDPIKTFDPILPKKSETLKEEQLRKNQAELLKKA